MVLWKFEEHRMYSVVACVIYTMIMGCMVWVGMVAILWRLFMYLSSCASWVEFHSGYCATQKMMFTSFTFSFPMFLRCLQMEMMFWMELSGSHSIGVLVRMLLSSLGGRKAIVQPLNLWSKWRFSEVKLSKAEYWQSERSWHFRLKMLWRPKGCIHQVGGLFCVFVWGLGMLSTDTKINKLKCMLTKNSLTSHTHMHFTSSCHRHCSSWGVDGIGLCFVPTLQSRQRMYRVDFAFLLFMFSASTCNRSYGNPSTNFATRWYEEKEWMP